MIDEPILPSDGELAWHEKPRVGEGSIDEGGAPHGYGKERDIALDLASEGNRVAAQPVREGYKVKSWDTHVNDQRVEFKTPISSKISQWARDGYEAQLQADQIVLDLRIVGATLDEAREVVNKIRRSNRDSGRDIESTARFIRIFGLDFNRTWPVRRPWVKRRKSGSGSGAPQKKR